MLSVELMLVPSIEEYLTNYFSGIRLTTSGSEQHTGLPQSLSEDYVHVVSHSSRHIWELPGSYSVLTVVMIIYHYVERIWRILVTQNKLYNKYDHK